MKKILFNICLTLPILSFAQNLQIVPLGVYGGSNESNLSSYLVAEENSTDYLALDGGTIYSGINKAIEKGTFDVDNSKVIHNFYVNKIVFFRKL